jgi:predicted RNA-binding Zn-ribbon protein involved in translation (DUF1610 family)
MNRKLLFGIAVIGVIAADLVVRTVLTGSPASSIGLLDAVFVVGGIALIQRWYKQGQTASPNALTSSSGSSVLSCSECGHQNPAEVNFCTKCRAKMTLQCGDCGFKSPQGSEFCGSCGAETEVGVAIRIRKEARAAAAATPKTIVQKVRHGIAVIFYIFAPFLALAHLAGGEPGEPWLTLSNLGLHVFFMLFLAGPGYWIDPSSYTDHYPYKLRKIFSKSR